VPSTDDRRWVLSLSISHCISLALTYSLFLALSLSRCLTLLLSRSLALSLSRSLALALLLFVSSHSCTDHVFSVSGSWPLSHSRSHSLTLSRPLALSPFRPLALSLALSISRSHDLALLLFVSSEPRRHRWPQMIDDGFFLSLFLTGPPTTAYRIVSTKRR